MNTCTPVTTTIREVGRYAGREVEIKGWLYNKRSSGSIHFLLLRDGSGVMQAVAVKSELGPEIFENAGRLTQESSLVVRGLVREDKRAPGGYELTLRELEILQIAEGYPITPKEHGTDFLMDNRHLWIRSQRQHAILRIRHEIMKAMEDFLDSRDFTRIDAPILTPSACEGTTNLFEAKYFDGIAFLSQSGQLYMEAAAMAFGKVYCFGPTFRAEKSKTRRHLMEFWMLEPEMAFCDQEQNMKIQEEFVSYVVQRVLEKRKPELDLLERKTDLLSRVKPPFPRITYDEALDILHASGVSIEWGGDFGGGDETLLAGKFETPFFVKNFPAACKAFYMKHDPERPEVAVCSDMLAPEGYGEIIGGGQRQDDPALLELKLKEHGLPEDAYRWYLDLRKYGTVPHSGFGIGIERTLSWICGLEHVRETIPFPRMLSRMYP
jgi:asparaginyl-tRNA synthetase